WPLDELDAVVETARELQLRVHLDGARLMNAAVALGVPAARIASQFDTATICLSKGLGCPLGALIAGSEELMQRAHVANDRSDARWLLRVGRPRRGAPLVRGAIPRLSLPPVRSPVSFMSVRPPACRRSRVRPCATARSCGRERSAPRATRTTATRRRIRSTASG